MFEILGFLALCLILTVASVYNLIVGYVVMLLIGFGKEFVLALSVFAFICFLWYNLFINAPFKVVLEGP